MANQIVIKHRTSTTGEPTLVTGEIAANIFDKFLFVGTGAGNLVFPDKAYVDNLVATAGVASGTSFDNTASGLTATDVQGAIDEVEGRVDTIETNMVQTGDSVTLTGDVTGSSTFQADGSVSVNTTASADWANVYNKPSTVAGFGITDAYTKTEIDTAINNAQLALGTNYSVADLTARSALTDLTVGDNVFVADDGDTKWAIYKVTAITDGSGSTSTFEKIMDEDVYLNAQSATAILTSIKTVASTLNDYGITDATPSSHIGTGGASHATATPTVHGFMSSGDKSKLDGIEAGATADQTKGDIDALGVDAATLGTNAPSYYLSWLNFTGLPTTLSGYGITDGAPLSHVGSAGAAHGTATVSSNGFMSSSDKTKLDGLDGNYTRKNTASISGFNTVSWTTICKVVSSHIASSVRISLAGTGSTSAVTTTAEIHVSDISDWIHVEATNGNTNRVTFKVLYDGVSTYYVQALVQSAETLTLTVDVESLSSDTVTVADLAASGTLEHQHIAYKGSKSISSNATVTDMYVKNFPVWTEGTLAFGTGNSNMARGDHIHAFADIASKPTTVAGYGITDGLTTSSDIDGGTY